MNKENHILLLNGITSSGKTSIANEILKISDENYYYVSIDAFAKMANQKYLNTYNSYFRELNDCISAMYSAVDTFINAEKHVILDTILLETPEMPLAYERLLQTCKRTMIFAVNVICPLDICIQRHKNRGNYDVNQPLWPKWQSERLKAIDYDMVVDTSEKSSEICANEILFELGKRATNKS